MMPPRLISLVLVWLCWTGSAIAGCETQAFDGVSYDICSYDAGRDDIRLFHYTEDGSLIGGFSRLEAELARTGKVLDFATNGGMYHDDRRAVGLYVENGTQEAPLVTRKGPGNFGLLPNGVFCLDNGTARIVESRAFARAALPCRFASQSGPMLVINGALHPKFLKDSDSRHIRNGVGVSADGRKVVFVISNARVNFHSFARLFRDHLRLPNALYFDGKVSRLFARDLGRADAGFPMGPMVGVVRSAR